MELPVDHLKHAMAPGQMASGIWSRIWAQIFIFDILPGVTQS